ncbi:MAG: sigma-70 family RNA polymerase sigma factor [Candidatus Cloacimonetes bacterium]|nr:sigma-70 family RNA polymerase sigma factor [Candidatus Cloacimonadota bacterium]
MKYIDHDLQKLQQLSYNYSLYRTGDFDLADEISMKTIGVFLLKADEIVSDQASKWIINTSKIHIQSHFRTAKQDHDNVKKYQQDLLNKLGNNMVTIKDTELSKTYREALQTLTNDEMKTILYYFQCDQKIRSMHLLLDISYDALRKKISRIKRKLKAETFKKLGVIVTKKIITPKINDLIVKFLKSFKTHLEENSLEKMYYYFSEVDLKKYNPSYEIEKIIDYEIELNKTVYKVWVFFKNIDNITDSFYIEFFIDENNHLKILTPPQKSEKVFKFNKDSEEGKKILQMLNSATVDKTGVSKFSTEELEKILKQIGEKKNST